MIIKRFIFFLFGLCLLSGCKSGEDYLSKGLNLSSEGNSKAAILFFEKAIQKNPFLKDAYIQLGLSLENLNQQDSAINVYLKLLKLYPDNTAAYYYSGICKYSQKKYKEAISMFNMAIDTKGGFNPTDTSSLQALLDLNKDNFESESVETDIPTRDILYDRGMAYYKTGQLKSACYDFTNCIFQKYNTGPSHYMIGLCKRTKEKKKYFRPLPAI